MKRAMDGTGRVLDIIGNMWFRIVAVAAAAVCLHAQSLFEKAPPEVDEALRTRVSTFYQAFVDGKFRLAEREVAEESQDYFYNMQKKRYYSFEIVSIKYTENFTRATVLVAIELDWSMPQVGTVRVKPPSKSLWKLVDGEWYWYVKADEAVETPFGKMALGRSGGSSPETFKGVDPKALSAGVKADKTVIVLSSAARSTADLTVENGMPGPVKIELRLPPAPGLTAIAEPAMLKSGESSKVTFDYNPPEKAPKTAVVVRLVVEPTKQEIPIQVRFESSGAVSDQGNSWPPNGKK